MAKTHTRQFRGPWLRAYAQMQLYLLEMLAAAPDPFAIRIRLAKALVTPDEIRRDFPPLRDALTGRFGPGRVQFEAVEGADSHEIRFEYAPASLVQGSWNTQPGPDALPANEQPGTHQRS